MHASHVIKYCKNLHKIFKIVRTRHIYVIDHEIISSDIDGSCDVYSSLKFDENGLLICVFI